MKSLKIALAVCGVAAVLSVSAAAFAHLPDPGFSVPVPDEWRAGRGDLLRPAIGGSDGAPVIVQENQPNPDTVIIGEEMEGEAGIKLFLLN